MQHIVPVLVNAEEDQLADFVLPDFERRAAVRVVPYPLESGVNVHHYFEAPKWLRR
jgi:hypothetical protein